MLRKTIIHSLMAILPVLMVASVEGYTLCDNGSVTVNSIKVEGLVEGGTACVTVSGNNPEVIQSGVVRVEVRSDSGSVVMDKSFNICSDIEGVSCPVAVGQQTLKKCISVPGEATTDMKATVKAVGKAGSKLLFCVEDVVTVG